MDKIQKIKLIYEEMVRIFKELHVNTNAEFIERHGLEFDENKDITLENDEDCLLSVMPYSIGFILRIRSKTAFCVYLADGNDDTEGLVVSSNEHSWTYIEFKKYNKHVPKKLYTETELIDLLPDGDSTELEFQYSTVYDTGILEILSLEKLLRPLCENISKHFYISFNNALKYNSEDLDKALTALKEMV